MLHKLPQGMRLVRMASKESGRAIWELLWEVVCLRFSARKLGFEEYFELALFRVEFEPGQRVDDLFGWRASAWLDERANATHWRACANDKLLMSKLLSRSADLPLPDIVACYSPIGRTLDGAPHFSDPSAFEAFLQESETFPLIVKPIAGTYGRGVIEISGCDEKGNLLGKSGDVLADDELSSLLENPHFGGALVQKKLKNHPALRELVGDTLSTVRMIVCIAEDKTPHLAAVFWKVARGCNVTDNFARGVTGNMLAGIDLASGAVLGLHSGLWPAGAMLTHHPETGKPVSEFNLPDWARARELVLMAARELPGLRLQGWDVALTDDGPLLLEVNTEISLEYVQFLTGKPFLSATVRGFFADLL